MIYFLLLYAGIYMGNAIYGTYMPVYFQSIESTPSQIGILLSVGPLVAIVAQPIWGSIGDRSRTKNTILRLLLIGSGLAILLFPLSTQFYFLLFAVCLFTFFQTSIFPLSDAITLEELEKHPRWSFGPIRLGGTIGFAMMSILFGWLANMNIHFLFPSYAIIMLITILLLTRLPKVAGYRSGNSQLHIGVLFKHRKLMVYMAINLVLQITLGYYYTFFPVHYKQIGGDSVLLGWAMVIAALSEVPFLLYADRLIRRVRIIHILFISSIATAIRWYIFYAVDNPYWLLPAQALHGFIFIVLTVTMAVYINQEVPKELKASGQALNALLSLGLARIIGSFFGGFASEAYGIRQIFLYVCWIAVACSLWIVWLMVKDLRAGPNKVAEKSVKQV